MLAAEPVERVVDDRELIVPSAEAPNDLSRDRVDLCDLSEMPPGHNVVSIPIDFDGVGVVEVRIRGLLQRRRGLDPVVQAEVIPGAPEEFHGPGGVLTQQGVTRDHCVGWPTEPAEIHPSNVVPEQVHSIRSCIRERQ